MTVTLQNNEVDEFTKSLQEIEQTQKMCSMLMRTPHYAKMGEVGIHTIVQKARSIGLNPLDALNGAMYFVNGKVELSANTMNYLIRNQGHSITKDDKSNSEICILRGKRADNGDTWTASFSIKEAKLAGIYKNVWEKYPDDMLFARALTRLARQLFADVLKGCYVEGEISSAIEAEKNLMKTVQYEEVKYPQPVEFFISDEQCKELGNLLSLCSVDYQKKFTGWLIERKNIDSLDMLPLACYENIKQRLTAKAEENYTVKPQENIVKYGEDAING